MRRMLGGGGRVLTGDAATEAAIKRADLSDYRIVHLAAHAVVDERRPERSAVLLAAGSDEEDGLLQFREVVELNLDGRIVILSACRSASGPLFGGDGVMGLAHAFFLAGSRTVVAGLWPLRDDEVAGLMERFAVGMSRGESVAGALASAQRELIRDGAPPAAWAGLIVMGDGDQVPLPGGRSRFPRPIMLVGGVFVLVVGVWVWRRRRS
jgi:CHAT domain-containing protein